MDTNNNCRPTPPSGDAIMDNGDWRTHLQPDSRQRIVNKIMDTLKRHLPFSGEEGLNELRKIAVRFEERNFTAASSQSDYLWRISLKMLTMESNSPNTIPNNGNNCDPSVPGSQGMQSQVHSQGQSIPMPLQSNQSEACQQLLPQSVLNNMASAGVQSSAGLQSGMPSVSASLDSTAQTGHVNGDDWQEEVYQKIKAMKEAYLPELNEMHQKIAAKLLQHDSLPQQPKSEQLDKLKLFQSMLERIINFLSVSKVDIIPTFKDKLSSYEKQIINFINSSRPRKPVPALQPGQLPSAHMHSMQQPQPHSNQTQSHDNQMNPQMQSINLQGSMPTMLPNNMTSLQHNSLSSLSGVSTAQQTMLNSLQPGSNLDPGQGNALGSMQQVAPGPLQQNPVSTTQQANISSLSSQSVLNVLLQNMNPFLSNSDIQHQHMKQQQEHQILQSQKCKQLQQRQMQQQYLKHQLLQQQQQRQQLHQQAKQQMPTQLQAHQMTQLHQMNDVNEMRQGIGVKAGVFQLPGYAREHSKPGAQFSTSSPLPFQAPFVPSTSTLLTPSIGDSEKPIYSTSCVSNIGHPQAKLEQSRSECLAPDTFGNGMPMSIPPLRPGFKKAEDTHGNALTTDYGMPGITEQSHDTRVNMAKPISLKPLSATVVTMVDEAAAAVGEDLAAIRKRRLHANFFTQTGMTGAEKMRCYVSALVMLALMFWFIFIHKSPILKL